MVDTGASSIALRESSAAKLGIHPSVRDYNIKMHTANGVGKAARVKLNRVELGGITVRDVDALVVPDESLSVNLLGMTFLQCGTSILSGGYTGVSQAMLEFIAA